MQFTITYTYFSKDQNNLSTLLMTQQNKLSVEYKPINYSYFINRTYQYETHCRSWTQEPCNRCHTTYTYIFWKYKSFKSNEGMSSTKQKPFLLESRNLTIWNTIATKSQMKEAPKRNQSTTTELTKHILPCIRSVFSSNKLSFVSYYTTSILYVLMWGNLMVSG